MQYEITLHGGSEAEQGKISLDRLAQLSEILMDIAYDAFQIRTQGYSRSARGRRPRQVMEAVQLDLSGLRAGSTVLMLESRPFLEQVGGVQLELDRPELAELYEGQTAMGLVIQSFQEALRQAPSDHLDKPLLQDMKKLQRMLRSEQESLTLSNGKPDSTVLLDHQGFARIQVLEQQTPAPRRTQVVGRLDVLEHSRARVTVILPEGSLRGHLTEALREGDISRYWGQELGLIGTAYYKPGGQIAYLHIDQITEPSAQDDYFRHLPQALPAEEQLARQLREGKKPPSRSDWVGAWRDLDEEASYEALAKLLRK
jgi:hypothetical protein